jgi:hypothetical protein
LEIHLESLEKLHGIIYERSKNIRVDRKICQKNMKIKIKGKTRKYLLFKKKESDFNFQVSSGYEMVEKNTQSLSTKCMVTFKYRSLLNNSLAVS